MDNNNQQEDKLKILIVDDYKHFCVSVSKYLTLKNYAECQYALNRQAALDILEHNSFDIITLDIEMGDEYGLQMLPEIRAKHDGPIIFISCISDSKVRIESLKKGGDDYLVKPFDIEELVIRAKKLISLYKPLQTLNVGDYELDLVNEKVNLNGQPLNLNTKNFKVLKLLLENCNTPLTREHIFKKVWRADYEFSSRVIDSAIVQLRSATNDSNFQTVRGVGYMYELKN